jgi:type II secretory pathway component GspD/PulD (secretin)
MIFPSQVAGRARLRGWVIAAFCTLSCGSALAQTPQSAVSVADNQLPAYKSLRKVTTRQKNEAEDAYLDGARRFKAKDYEGAEHSFLRAMEINPTRDEYVMAVALGRQHQIAQLVQQAAAERQQNHNEKADALLAQARSLDPTNPLVQQHALDQGLHQQATVDQLAGAIPLQATQARHSFHLRGDTRAILQQVATQYGLKAVFDSSLTSKNLRLDLDDVTYAQTIGILQMMANVFVVSVDEHTFLAADDTETNRQRLERQEEETLSLPGLTTEELNDVVNIIRNVFSVRQVSAAAGNSIIVVRAPAETINAVNQTLADLIDGGSEVLIKLQIYSVSNQRTRNIGITPPQQVSAASAAALAQNLISQNQSTVQQLIAAGVIPANASQLQIALALIAAGVANNSLINGAFLKLGGGLTTALISAGNSATLNFALQSSSARELDEIQLRIGDRQSATFRSGTRYPITTSVYSSVATTSTNSALSNITVNGVSLASLLSQNLGGASSATTIPQIQYEDLGFTLKATPHVLRTGEIALHMELKVESLTGAALNNIPVLSSRQLTSDLRIHSGETALIMGYMNEQESAAIDGTPGLSELPGFQSVTDRNTNKQTDELVILLTPVLVRRGHLNLAGPYIPVSNHGID